METTAQVPQVTIRNLSPGSGTIRNLAPHITRQRLILEFWRHGHISASQIRAYFTDMAATLGMSIVDMPAPSMASGYGLAGWVHWDFSGAEIMCWDEPGGWGFATITIYTCRPFAWEAAADVTIRHFGPVIMNAFPVLTELEGRAAPPPQLPPRRIARARRRLMRSGLRACTIAHSEPAALSAWRPRIEAARRNTDWLASRHCRLDAPGAMRAWHSIWDTHAAAGRLRAVLLTLDDGYAPPELAGWRITAAGYELDAGTVRSWRSLDPVALLAAGE